MKNILTTILLIWCLPSISQAQLVRGTWTIGGQFTAEVVNVAGDTPLFQASIAPQFGVFVTDHWLLGGGVGGFVSSGVTDGGDAFLTPFARYYFNPAAPRANFFAGASAAFILDRDFFNSLGVEAGLSYFLTPGVALDLTAGLTFTESSNPGMLGVGLRAFLNPESRSGMQTAGGEFEAGSWLLGTSRFSATMNRDLISLAISPNVGTFLTDQWVVGLAGGLAWPIRFNKHLLRFRTYQARPFVRYYFTPARHLNWFAEASAGIESSYFRNGDVLTQQAYRGIFQGSLGANLFLTNNLALEAGLLVTHFTQRDITRLDFDETFGNIFQVEPGPQGDQETRIGLRIGLQFFINRR
ncbi:MAG: hypothetical protein KDC54_15845 [Lewinella sp.]|nr:hypothetical protein [Lewinella sp.]